MKLSCKIRSPWLMPPNCRERNVKTPGVYCARMPLLMHYHLKPSLLALLDERLAGFCPLCEMEKMFNDAQTPPKLKVRLRKDLATYTGVAVSPRKTPAL
jgi:hypothetical protein